MTIEEVTRLFRYENGELYWMESSGKHKAGDIAGGAGKTRRYKEVRVNGKTQKVHRVIFLLVNGWLPDIIDHINNNKFDNRADNLRAASKSLNSFSTPASSANTSGVVGVKWQKKDSAWTATIISNGARHHLGFFKNKDDAITARKNGEIKYFGEYKVAGKEVGNG